MGRANAMANNMAVTALFPWPVPVASESRAAPLSASVLASRVA